MTAKIQNIAKYLNYKFVNNNLLTLALTHSSYNSSNKDQNNQRLEFLGDSILNLVITENLYKLQPEATEGELSRIRAYLVKEQTLASIAKQLFIQDDLILGLGEQKTGGYNKQSILADTFEAIIGAIYLDSDLLTVKNLILDWYLKFAKHNELDDQQFRDPKTILQETLQAKNLSLPIYNIIKITGKAHNQQFQIECLIDSVGAGIKLQQKIYGFGASRQKAEQDAAKKILGYLIYV